MVTNFRFWLISSFGAILLICIFSIIYFSNSITTYHQLVDYHANLKTARILLLETNKLKEDVFIGTQTDSNFFTSEKSWQELKFQKLNHQTNEFLSKMENNSITNRYELNNQLFEIK